MGRYSIKNPETGLWACFSSVVDDFICDWMSKEEYIEWVLSEERSNVEQTLKRIEEKPWLYKSYEECQETIEWRKSLLEDKEVKDG